jgi:prevent-host-death family protein
MTKTITATQAKAELLGLIDAVANGDSGPVTITKHGKAKVMLVPVPNSSELRIGFGALQGQAIAKIDYDASAPTLDDEPSYDAENLIL